jgi:hypothetical protein
LAPDLTVVRNHLAHVHGAGRLQSVRPSSRWLNASEVAGHGTIQPVAYARQAQELAVEQFKKALQLG